MEEERIRIYMTVDMDIVYLAENIQYYAINREVMEIEHISQDKRGRIFMTSIQVGYILRSDSKGFVTGSPVSQKDIPDFGSLVSAPLEDTMRSYGLIYDIRILDDGLVRQRGMSPRKSSGITASAGSFHWNFPSYPWDMKNKITSPIYFLRVRLSAWT